MLRAGYDKDVDEIKEIIGRFQINDSLLLGILDQETLSPDSFIWKLKLTDGEYFLYAEDYIPNLNHVIDEIETFAGKNAGSLVPVKHKKHFEDLEPVKAATVYATPPDVDNLQSFVTDSGIDMVFLYRLHKPTGTGLHRS